MPKAQLRIDTERENLQKGQDFFLGEIENLANKVGPYVVQESQYADDRCVSRGTLSPDEELFATSGWSGICRVWGVPDCQLRTELKGHTERVISIRFHP